MYPISLVLSSQVFIALRSMMLQNCFAGCPTLTARFLQAEAEGCEPTVLQLRDVNSRGTTEIWWFGHPDTLPTCGIKIKSHAVSSSRLGCPDSARIMSSRKSKINARCIRWSNKNLHLHLNKREIPVNVRWSHHQHTWDDLSNILVPTLVALGRLARFYWFCWSIERTYTVYVLKSNIYIHSI